MLNAGERLWTAQRAQGTGLCIGLDPHLDVRGVLNSDFYFQFGTLPDVGETYEKVLVLLGNVGEMLPFTIIDRERTARCIAGMIKYYSMVIKGARSEGILVFKPQSAFYERIPILGQLILALICKELESGNGSEFLFKLLDAKRGDIATTQEPYYAAYLTDKNAEVAFGANGIFGFDTMTVTSWMGDDVLSPGLPYFKAGKGATVVTRSSNPSGTTLQDAHILPSDIAVSDKQDRFRYKRADKDALSGILGRDPTAHEVMLYLTSKFSADNDLDQNRVSPLFSVMGSTLDIGPSFRQIRGDGAIALVPGFGAQRGAFDKIEPLIVREGPLTGHWGVLASSRAHNFSWMTEYGGNNNPHDVEAETRRAIASFREDERAAYAAAKADYPF